MKVSTPSPFSIRKHRRRRSRILLLFLLPLISVQILSAQQTESAAKPVPASTPPTAQANDKPASSSGTIKGRIVVPGGRVPKNALVAIRSLNETSGQSFMRRVDSDGRFVFDDLSAGVYTVIATAPGFIDESLSALDLTEMPRHLPGAQITVRMVKGGVITGTVTNQRGEPVVGVSVRVLLIGDQRSVFARFAGEPLQVETDDRGIYRIYGLPPGEYLVAAGGRGPFGPFMPTGFDSHSPTYYPSSNRDTAVPVEVRNGEEATSVDIRYRGHQGHSVSGVVRHTIDKTTHVNISSVMLFDAKNRTMLAVATSNMETPERSFKFEGVADGEYELFATFFAREEANWSTGTKKLTVSGADISGVEIPLKMLSSFEGSIKLEPSEVKCDKRGSQVVETLLYASGETEGRGSRLRTLYGLDGSVTPNNNFVIRNIEPGRFRLTIHLPTDAWYLKDIQLPAPQTSKAAPPSSTSRTPQWQGMATIKQGEKIRDVIISVGQDAAGLSGHVSLPKGVSTVPENLRVHLVPVEREQANNVLRYYETGVESNGQFRFSHVAPGRYFSITRTRPEDAKAPRNPEAWDVAARGQLRRVAEISKNEIELKSCQKPGDYVLKVGPPVN